MKFINLLFNRLFNRKVNISFPVSTPGAPPAKKSPVLNPIMTHPYKTRDTSPNDLKKGDQLLMNDGRVLTVKAIYPGIFENSIAIYSTDPGENQICYLVSNPVKVII